MLRASLFFATVAGLLGAAAIAQGAGYDHRVARACAGMGLNPSEAPFIYCEMSLRENAGSGLRAHEGAGAAFRSHQRGDAMASVHRACAQIGLIPGSQQYATCVGNLDMTIEDADRVGTD